MDSTTSTTYFLTLVSTSSSILAMVTKFLTSLLVISYDRSTISWIILSSIISNQFKISAPFIVSSELTNGMNELSSYSSVVFSTSINLFMVLSPSMFTTIFNGVKSSIDIYLVVSQFFIDSRFIIYSIIFSFLFHSKISMWLTIGSFPLSWTFKTSSFEPFPNNELDSLILSISICSFFFSLSFHICFCNLLSYDFLFYIASKTLLFIVFVCFTFQVCALSYSYALLFYNFPY